LVSLQPHEAGAAAASKLKGQASKWLRQALHREQPANLFSKGYFACTTGKSTQEQVHAYLDRQAEHHGYADRVVVPVYVESPPPLAADEARVRPQHAWTVLRFHLVLTVWRRRGVFGGEEGQAVAARWRQLQATERFVLQKVSFLPDHVHLAVRVHLSVVPAELVVALMNTAQQVVYEGFPRSVIRAGVERLWQPSAYVGSFGDLATPQVQAYLRSWKAESGS
ncbi:MAG: transposase, partial [Gemmataceae bacterium]|nr:transposase [Gemmataceae bacterium]